MMIRGFDLILTFWTDDGARGVLATFSDNWVLVVMETIEVFIVLLASSDFAVFDAVVFEESGLILKGKKSLTWDSMVMSFGSLFFVCRFELLVVFCLVWKNMAMFLRTVLKFWELNQ